MGLYAGELLDLAVPQSDKRLYTFVETDGCFADRVSVATSYWTGLLATCQENPDRWLGKRRVLPATSLALTNLS